MVMASLPPPPGPEPQPTVEQYGTFFGVSLRDVYDQHGKELAELRVNMNDANRKLDTLIEVDRRLDHEGRLRSLERWKYGIPIAAVTSLGGGILIAVAG